MNPHCLAMNNKFLMDNSKEYEYFVFDSNFENGNLDLVIKV